VVYPSNSRESQLQKNNSCSFEEILGHLEDHGGGKIETLYKVQGLSSSG
jgi:hypothetical protein